MREAEFTGSITIVRVRAPQGSHDSICFACYISRNELGERKGEIERGERELGSLQKLARQHGLGHNPSFLPFLFPAWFTQGLSEFNFMFSGSLSAIALNETPLLKLFEKYFSAEQ